MSPCILGRGSGCSSELPASPATGFWHAVEVIVPSAAKRLQLLHHDQRAGPGGAASSLEHFKARFFQCPSLGGQNQVKVFTQEQHTKQTSLWTNRKKQRYLNKNVFSKANNIVIWVSVMLLYLQHEAYEVSSDLAHFVLNRPQSNEQGQKHKRKWTFVTLLPSRDARQAVL